MNELLYLQLRKNWNYLHPVTKVLSRIEYESERIFGKLKQLGSDKSGMFFSPKT